MILKVLSSWLQERRFSVIVNGTQSKWHELRDSVYQGTVWGPPLWNCFYEDATRAIHAEHFMETVFADD